MAKCQECGAETELYCNDVPICLACLNALEPETKPPERETEDQNAHRSKSA